MADIRTPSANALTFSFSTQALRVVIIDGEPWFVAADVCEALAVGNVSLAVNGRADRADGGLDDDEKGIASVNTPSGDQQMLVVNESGLYALIFKSRKPEAKKFKKWVTAEVLPAIRKTGRYEISAARPEPQPAPAAAREKLNAADMQHMKRIVWFAGRNFHSQESATQGIWYYLRQITHNPAPNAYGVDHIPVLAAELRRVLALCDQVGRITRSIEAQAVKRIFRNGETADKVLAQLAVEAARSVQQLNDHVAEFPTWMEGDLLNFTERKPAYHGAAYTPEQPDFFLSVA
jgi:prophage antirepressor-like protein